MKTMMKIGHAAFALAALGWCGCLPTAAAVSPAPDGGYPGGNTAEGQSALFSLTSGGYNTAVGYLSLRSDRTNGLNTAVGAGTLLANTADENTALGAGALLSNTTGNANTANGSLALIHNTTGIANTATGREALFTNSTGNYNTAVGAGALNQNTVDNNTAVGVDALHFNTNGTPNTAVGVQALYSNTTGILNTAVGDGALANSNGIGNTALGANAGSNVTTGEYNICIGSPGLDVSNGCFIGSIWSYPSAGGTPVLINSDDRLGTNTSSRRFKEDIKPMDQASTALFALKPVSFHYKKEIDPKCIPQFGLVAEDVEEVNPDLVVRDKEGKPHSVRYDQVNAMLLNEFLKEHRKVEQQEATITQLKRDFQSRLARQQKQIEALTAGLQKVSAQIELNKPAPQTVLNNQ